MSYAVAQKPRSNKARQKKDDRPNVTVKGVQSTPATFIQLKAICPCDGGCPSCAPLIQPKLTIGQPNDKYEQEADRVAEQVISILEPMSQSKPIFAESSYLRPEEIIMTKQSQAQKTISLVHRQDQEYSRIQEVSGYAKTECDVKVHLDDFNNYLLNKKFRTVGKGKPQIKVLVDNLQSKYPCLYEAVIEHEKEHVKTIGKYCSAFKQCVDKQSSKFLWIFGEPTISKDDFEECYKTNYGGTGPDKDCIKEEKVAYEAGIKKAKELLDEKKCLKEKNILEANIKEWESIKDSAPNCKKSEKKGMKKGVTYKKGCQAISCTSPFEAVL